jgi:serine/threonine protein kinase
VAIKVVERSNLLKTKKISSSDSTEESDVESEPDFVSRSVMAQNDQEIMQLVDKETRIMSTLDHPHVINLEEVYEDDTRVCFVMELAQGGEVFDRLLQKVSFDEMQTADLVGQVLCAMSYIHTQVLGFTPHNLHIVTKFDYSRGLSTGTSSLKTSCTTMTQRTLRSWWRILVLVTGSKFSRMELVQFVAHQAIWHPR